MNILITIQSFYDGGAEMAAIRLANQLAKSNHHVHFLELNSYNSIQQRQKDLLVNEIKLFRPDLDPIVKLTGRVMRHIPIQRNYIGAFISLVKKLRIGVYLIFNRIRIVNSHFILSDEYFSYYRRYGIKLVSSFHGHYEIFNENHFGTNYKIRIYKILHGLDHVVYTSPRHLRTLKENNFEFSKTTKIYYSFDPTRLKDQDYIPNTGQSLIISVVSRAIKEKGWEELILAAIFLNKKFENRIIVQLVGDGEEKERLELKYSNCSFIKFCGYKNQDEIFSLLEVTHVAILPSYYKAESMPNSVIEYLACGKPVISTNIGAIKEMVTTDNNQIAGFIIDLRDNKISPSDLANAIEQYILNPGLIREHSCLSRLAFTKFDAVNNSKKYLELFNKLVH